MNQILSLFVTLALSLSLSNILLNPNADHLLYLPMLQQPAKCPQVSINVYDLTQINGGYYKGNRLTDENADFRLSILGYAPAAEAPQLVNYGQAPDANAAKLSGVLKRVPAFTVAYRVRNWNWNESAPPPYGTPGPINSDTQIPPIVLDVATAAGEAIYPASRNPSIDGAGHKAMVLYAAENELTLAYANTDSVVDGYLVHLTRLCVDPNLVLLYRAQLVNGKRATGKLPAVRNGQVIGTALGSSITLAIRDRGRYMDARSQRDWWQ